MGFYEWKAIRDAPPKVLFDGITFCDPMSSISSSIR
jgi:hypothetical protein